MQRRRPEVSAAVALVVERATAKDPDERYQQVGEMIDDLSTALEVEAARAGSTTGEATSVLDAVPPPKRKLSGPGPLELGGDRRAAADRRRRAAGGGPADLERQHRRWRCRQGQGQRGHDHLGDRLRPPGRRRGGRQQGRTRGRRRPDRHRLGNRALRHPTPSPAPRPAPTPASASTSPTSSPAKPTKMIVRTPTPGWDAQIFATASGPAGRTLRMGRTGRHRRRRQRDRGNRPHRPRPGHATSCSGSTRPPKPATRTARYQVEISDIKLLR